MMRAMRELVRHVRDVSISTKMLRIHTRTMTAVVTNVVPLGDRTDGQLIGDRMRRARSPVYLHVPVTGAELAEGVFDALVGLGDRAEEVEATAILACLRELSTTTGSLVVHEAQATRDRMALTFDFRAHQSVTRLMMSACSRFPLITYRPGPIAFAPCSSVWI